MEEAIEDGTLRKDVDVVQNRPADGKTVTQSIADEVEADQVRLHKIDKQR